MLYLAVIEVGGDFRAELHELEHRLCPGHRNLLFWVLGTALDANTMNIDVTAAAPASVEADLLALATSGKRLQDLDALLEGRLATAAADADPVAVVQVAGELAAHRVAAVAIDDVNAEGLRTAAARAVRAHSGARAVAWAFDPSLPVDEVDQIQAVVEGAVLGGYDAGRWKSGAPPRGVDRFIVCGAREELREAAARAEIVARWTNVARELVDAPPNVATPSGLAERAAAIGGLQVEALNPVSAGLTALAAVGGSSSVEPTLIVLRHEPPNAPASPRLALVGKAVTFDAGGYFLKPQADIVRQKSDMAGGAAVLAALGAIAELDIPMPVIGVLAACENMLGAHAMRPSDVITTAAGLTVEVTNPDAEGRLILADALWYARGQRTTHIVDLATLTGAMRSGMGDLYGGVFANDDAWRAAVVDAGNAVGDLAWPWPLHRRYRRLLDSKLADLRNTSGKGFGYPITAAAFLERFAGEEPWAHVDMIGPALLDEDRGDALGPGASGYGVRMLIELASRLSDPQAERS
jgi:leucyl aminopeptidase